MDQSNRIQALVVFRGEGNRQSAVKCLESRLPGRVSFTHLESIEQAIEHLENARFFYSIILFEYLGKSQTLIRAVLDLGGTSAFVLCGMDPRVLEGIRDQETPIAFASLSNLDSELGKAIKSLELSGRLPWVEERNAEYIEIQGASLPGMGPMQGTVYLKMLDGRYIPVFKAGDRILESDIQHFLAKRPDQEFYLKRDELKALLRSRSGEIEALTSSRPIEEERLEKTIRGSYGLVRDVVREIGFTPEAQSVAIASVEATLKILGARPKMKVILENLRSKEGDYIPSHSLNLGKVACALAHKIGWRSETTYFKLSLAAFLHDISLEEDSQAKVFDLQLVSENSEFTADAIREIKMHPIRAAEYARQFQEVPYDVEQIVSQHHERPNGSGYPRGLVVRFFTPLSALFIVAQDLIEYSEENGDISFDGFFKKKELEYNVGIFRKIARALQTDTTLQ